VSWRNRERTSADNYYYFFKKEEEEEERNDVGGLNEFFN